jgi:N-acetylmuramoyl-L-alanine amidase
MASINVGVANVPRYCRHAVAARWRLTAGLAFAACVCCHGVAQLPAVPAPAPPPPRPDLPALPAPLMNRSSVQPAFVVVIDPAHGGADTGARISANVLEKDLTLAMSIRLRSTLTARGIAVVTTRESDTDPKLDERAGVANHALAAACLVIHATASGSGVHLFTSSLGPAAPASGGMVPSLVPWQTAQAAWIARSLRLSSEVNSNLGQAGVPVTLGSTALQPLDSLACPAVAIEIAPLPASPANKATAITDQQYQQHILDALAAAMLAWSTNWKQQP